MSGTQSGQASQPNVSDGVWRAGADDFAVRIEARDVDGRLIKEIIVEPGQQLLLLEDGRALKGTLGPGRYALSRVLDPGASRRTAWVVVDGPVVLDFPLENLHTADNIRVGGVCKLTIGIANPTVFFAQVMRGRSRFLRDDLRDLLFDQVRDGVQDFVQECSLPIRTSPSNKQRVKTAILAHLEQTLQDSGIALGEVRTYDFTNKGWEEIRDRKGEIALGRMENEVDAGLAEVKAGHSNDAPGQQTGHAPVPPTPQWQRIGIDLVSIPAGEFLMGSDPARDGQASSDEGPQHRVYLPAFQLSRTPVTNRQYKDFVDATGHRMPQTWAGGKIPRGKEDHPVAHVSWHDTLAFCAWAGLRLPSEAEWEKGARGTDGRWYPWGNEAPDAGRCNCSNMVNDTTPVGIYPLGASPYGLLDMAGNVREWTSTVLRPYPYGADDGREHPAVPGSRVLRGGSWDDVPRGVRAAARLAGNPDLRYADFGFRCARSL